MRRNYCGEAIYNDTVRNINFLNCVFTIIGATGICSVIDADCSPERSVPEDFNFSYVYLLRLCRVKSLTAYVINYAGHYGVYFVNFLDILNKSFACCCLVMFRNNADSQGVNVCS